jgi:5'-methylthioadenosine phosphorylase
MAVHVELSHPFCQGLRERVLSLDDKVDTTVHTGGTYVCMEGPQFSTIAESETHRAWGGDLIGMTVMPEAKLAREAEMCYALVALATDYDCWRPHDPNVDRLALLAEILSHLRAATDFAVQLIRATVADVAQRPPERCACHDALQLAIWSNKKDVQPALVQKLRPLVGRYFADTP